MILSSLFFAIMSAMIKLTGDLPLFEKVVVRNLIIMLPAAYMALKTGAPLFGKRENQKFLLWRAIAGTLGVITFFYSVDNLYLADSAMLNKLSPFFVTFLACILLKEKISKIQLPALVIVFAAAQMIIKPRFDLTVIPALSGFLSALMSAAAYTLLRHLRDKERPETIIFYFSTVTVISTFPLMALNFRMPVGSQWIYLLGTGLAAAGGQFYLTLAYKYSEANEVSLYLYFHVIFAAVIGYILWREVSDWWSISGGIVIIVISISVFLYNRKYKDR